LDWKWEVVFPEDWCVGEVSPGCCVEQYVWSSSVVVLPALWKTRRDDIISRELLQPAKYEQQ
jgi:hypothetical protein